jgi:hypothetical protein
MVSYDNARVGCFAVFGNFSNGDKTYGVGSLGGGYSGTWKTLS